VFGVGGWKWTVPILTFFILSSLLSKIGRPRKMETESMFDKTGVRDVGQVAANGGVAGFLVFLQYVFQDLNFYPIYLGAVAAVTADTWGTEIGTYFKWKTVSIVTLRKVTPGASGGVSLPGLFAGVFGALIVALSAVAWIGSSMALPVAIVAGIIGSASDSVMGASVQAQYRCGVCGKITERTIHCGATTEFVSGIRWINNDLVNWVCAIVGALTVLFLGSFH
jgi:uncharacterized protein (TIGR00297 family)